MIVFFIVLISRSSGGAPGDWFNALLHSGVLTTPLAFKEGGFGEHTMIGDLYNDQRIKTWKSFC